jgi:PKD repeat protein
MGERVTNGNFADYSFDGWTLVNDGSGWDTYLDLNNDDDHVFAQMQNEKSSSTVVSIAQSVDLTNVDTLSFLYYNYTSMSISPAVNGSLYIDSTRIMYFSRTWNWTDVEIDVSSYTGNHTITFLCGYDLYLAELGITSVSAIGSDTPDPPVAAFTGFPVSGEAPLVVLFTDESTNTPTSWLWDFGDGLFSTDQNPFHTFTLAGSYDVALRATNDGGDDLLLKHDYITVTEPPPPPIIYYPIWSIPIGRLP